MSKKNKDRYRPNPPSLPVVPQAPTLQSMQIKVDQLLSEAEVAQSAELSKSEANDPLKNAADVIQDAERAKRAFEIKKAQLDGREQDLAAKEKKLSDQRHSQEEKDKSIWLKEKELTKIEDEQNKRELELAKRDEAIKKREADAQAEFVRLRQEAFASFDAELEKLRLASSAYQLRHIESLKDLDARLSALRTEDQAKLEAERSRLYEQEAALRSEIQTSKSALEQERREVDWMREDLIKERQALHERIKSGIEAIEADLKTRLDSAHKRIREQAGELARYADAERAAAGRTREQLVADNDSLRREADRLRKELGTKPSSEQLNRLQNLESDNESLLNELNILRQRNRQLESIQAKSQIGVAEVQNLRDQKSAWESRESALRASIEELKSELDMLTEKANAQPPFPALTKLDGDKSLQTPAPSTSATGLTLHEIVKYARHGMALPKEGRTAFYYSESDIRCFLAGLASNKLHIFQGISGTGKSSLPREISRVLGWGHELIEVQSGWRDRTDLLGHYNSFERKFYESKFLRALYEAQCPRYREAPYLVTLDEMNLSHPEHYFADLLSALEQPASERRVDLMTVSVNPAPNMLEQGRRIRIPENVWFIGTANHDETTKDFADKTYDRSHVMEFPRHPDSFVANNQIKGLREIITLGEISELFEKARRTHEPDVTQAKKILRDLRPSLESLEIGWGNRLESQLSWFVPVIVAAGGSVVEALDHVISTKLLRKLRGRFDLEVDLIKALQAKIEASWKEHGATGVSKCRNVLVAEIRQHQGNRS